MTKRKHKWLPGEKGVEGGDVYEYVPDPPGEVNPQGVRFRLLSTNDPKRQDWVGVIFWKRGNDTPVPCRLRSPDEEPAKWLPPVLITLGSVPTIASTLLTVLTVSERRGVELLAPTLLLLIGSQYCLYRLIRAVTKEEFKS